MSPSETRKRLTDGIFISDQASNPVGLLELALPRVIATEPLERRLQKAETAGELGSGDKQSQLKKAVELSIISAEEARELEAVRTMVTEIIKVDEFEGSYLKSNARGVTTQIRDEAA